MQRGEIGKRLRKLRELRRVSQKWLAEQTHVSRSSISKYENGFASLDVDLADQVLRALGGICVLGVDLTAEESREISRHIDSLRKEKLRKEREKQNAVFQKYREKEESQRGNR